LGDIEVRIFFSTIWPLGRVSAEPSTPT